MPIQYRFIVQKNTDLDEIARQLEDRREVLKRIQTYRKDRFEHSIRSNRDARGNRVAKLSPRYAEQKRLAGFGGKPIRVRTGKMISTYRSRIYRDRLIETMESPIASYHQDGTDRMPQRMLFPETFEDMPQYQQKEMKAIVTRYYKELFRKARKIRGILNL